MPIFVYHWYLCIFSGVDGLQQVEEHQNSDDSHTRTIVPDYYVDSFAHFGQFIADL